MLFHHRHVYGIPSREPPVTQNNLLGAFHGRVSDGQNFIDDSKQCIESGLDGVAPIDGHVPVQYFLQDFGVGHQTLSAAYQFLQQSLSIRLVPVRRTHQIHRDIGIDENHEREPLR